MTKAEATRKGHIHVSVDPMLVDRIRAICSRMGLPVSHFASLALSREAARFESEFGTGEPGKATRSARP